jgi:phage terminase small subunit
MNLTPKQEKFCLVYLESGNASEAYRLAYDASNMKMETVNRRAFDLLQNSKIKARINGLRDAVAEKAIVTEARVIEEAARIGLLDPARLVDKNGALLQLHEMAPEVRAAIASIEVSEDRDEEGKVVGKLKKVKLWDKNSAIEKIMKHLGMFERDNKQKAGIFDDVPTDTLRIIEEKLRGLQRSDVAGYTAAGSTSRFTH